MINVLITGGCGFIGSNLINYLYDKYPHLTIINIDRLDYCSNKTNVKCQDSSRYILIEGDVKDTELVHNSLKQYSIDTVIHIAAQSHVDNSFGNSLNFTLDNVFGTHVLVECCKQIGIKKFIYFSTDEVYGENNSKTRSTEQSILCPTNPYAASKACAELIVSSYFHSWNFPVIITRCNNVYGRFQYPEKVIPKFIHNLLNNKTCSIHGQGMQKRAFIHVHDVCTALDIILHKANLGETYNIGTLREFNINEIAHKLVNILKPNENVSNWIVYIPDPRPFNDKRYHIDNHNLQMLGWKESVDFDDGLKSIVEWYALNKNYFTLNDV